MNKYLSFCISILALIHSCLFCTFCHSCFCVSCLFFASFWGRNVARRVLFMPRWLVYGHLFVLCWGGGSFQVGTEKANRGFRCAVPPLPLLALSPNRLRQLLTSAPNLALTFPCAWLAAHAPFCARTPCIAFLSLGNIFHA